MARKRRRRPPSATPQRSTAPLSPDKLLNDADSLLREEITVDQQHQLLTVKRYLELEPDITTTHGQAALRSAELLLEGVRGEIHLRRHGTQA